MARLTWTQTPDGWRSDPYTVRRLRPHAWVLEQGGPAPGERGGVLVSDDPARVVHATAPTASLCKLEAERHAARAERRHRIRHLLERLALALALLAAVAVFAPDFVLVALALTALFAAWSGGEVLWALSRGPWDDLGNFYQ